MAGKEIVGFAGDTAKWVWVVFCSACDDNGAWHHVFNAGLGNMGLAMATNLQEYLSKRQTDGTYNSSLLVWNRTQSKAQPLVQQGASLAPSISRKPLTPSCVRVSVVR